MCGRAKLSTPGEELAKIFDLAEVPLLEPHWNLAPTQTMAIIREPRRLEFARFGFIPSFARSPKEGTRYLNARAETVATLSAFRDAFRTRRCLVIVDGFYEWKTVEKKKQPYLLERPNGAPFALAGVWTTWTSRETGEIIDSCAIITKPAKGVARELHDRMPLILPSSAWAKWLDMSRDAADLLETDDFDLVARPVSVRVNSPQNDDPGCVDPPET